MITVIFLIVIAGAAIGGIYLAMASGTKGGRQGQSSKAVAEGQGDSKPAPRATGTD